MLTRWYPFQREQVNGGLSAVMDDLFNDPFFRSFSGAPLQRAFAGTTSWTPSTDIVETEEEWMLSVDLPGHDARDIQLKVEGDTLTVQSERRQEKSARGQTWIRSECSYGRYARSFVLPNTVDASRAQARYENGVLTVTLPKKEEARPRTIEIKVRS